MKKLICRPIFLIGMPRSGTTVLSEAIAAHEDLGWISNYVNRLPMLPWLALFDRMADNSLTGGLLRGKKKQDLNLWSFFRKFLPHPDEALKFWQRFCGDKFLWDYLVNQSALPVEKDSLVKALHNILVLQGKKRLFTKLTGPPRIHYLSTIFPDAGFIHLLRDPRAVVSSLLRVNFWRFHGGLKKPWWKNGLPGEYLAEWEASGKSPVVLAAIQWKRVVELTWEEKNRIAPEQFYEIKYEEFVQDPHAALSRVFAAFDLADAKRAHRYLDTIGQVIEANYQVNNYLSAEQLKQVETVTRETASLAGYNF